MTDREQESGAFCPVCVSFGVDCNPDVEDYCLPCEHFKFDTLFDDGYDEYIEALKGEF